MYIFFYLLIELQFNNYRALHMILLFFEKIVEDAKTTTPTEDLVAFLKKSYKEALEPYHGWMAQQLFDVSIHSKHT